MDKPFEAETDGIEDRSAADDNAMRFSKNRTKYAVSPFLAKNRRSDRLAIPAAIAAMVLTTGGLLLAFFYTPPVSGAEVDGAALIGGEMVTAKLLISQKIFYFHMPIAITSFVAIAFACYYSVRFLINKNIYFDTCAKTAMEIALLFVVATMITGELWTRFEWGLWWTWEPRLSTYLILMLIVIAYFALRKAVDVPERRAAFAAVISVIAFIDVPICYLVTRLIPASLHPVVLREGAMTADIAIAVFVCMCGMFLLGFALYRLRLRQYRLWERVLVLSESIDNRKGFCTLSRAGAYRRNGAQIPPSTDKGAQQ